MFTFSAPGGRASLSIRSAYPDPNRRFSITVSDGFGISADGLRDLAKQINAFAKEVSPKPVTKKAPTVAPETDEKPTGGDA